MEDGGLVMKFFQHYFPPGSRKVVERIPADVLIARAYEQHFEVSVISECVTLVCMWCVTVFSKLVICVGVDI